MTVSAHDVAAVLCERLPDLPRLKKHKLLYYCQGHHLAAFGKPLFSDIISAWDHGPVVGTLWYDETRGQVPREHTQLNEAELNTIGYVLSRYGGLTGKDLEILTHNEMPWQRADEHRRPSESIRIEQDWMREYFRTAGAPDADGDIVLDSEQVSKWLADAETRLADPLQPDDLETLRGMARHG